jgi:hypothetical protein
MAVIEIAKIQVRRGQENQTGIPRLDPGEFAWAEDTERLYIGKRIAEGASTDENSRILTEQDLNFFKLASLSTTTSASAYQYREGVFGADTPVHRVQDKLDSYVTLFDFGVSPYFSNNTGVTVNSTGTAATTTFIVSTTTGISVGMRITGSPSTTGITGYVTSVSSYLITSTAINLNTWTNQTITFYDSDDLNAGVDITLELTTAIQNLFNNIKNVSDARRRLIIPSGNFYISKTIALPPFTTIEGEGVDLTALTMTTPSPMFVTVDSYGTGYPSMLTASTQTSRNISIKGMTLAYASTITSTTTNALLSLDNVKGAVVENVKFYSAADGVSTGTGIQLRGQITGAVDIETCSDIQINHCTFDNLYTGVLATGTVLRPVIGKSIFTNLDKGIVMTASTSSLYRSPIGAKFIENRFDRISDEAIYVGVASHVTNHISEQNTFRHVGNKRGIDSSVTTSTDHSPVISFLADGNSSVNDTFNRKLVAATKSSTSTFYYNPLVLGNASINSTEVTTATVVTGSTSTFFKIPLTGKDQMLFMKYSLYSVDQTVVGYSRKGVLTINIASDGFGSFNDRFNYSIITPDNFNDPSFAVDSSSTYTTKGYVILTCTVDGKDVPTSQSNTEFRFEAQADAIV